MQQNKKFPTSRMIHVRSRLHARRPMTHVSRNHAPIIPFLARLSFKSGTRLYQILASITTRLYFKPDMHVSEMMIFAGCCSVFHFYIQFS